MSDGVVFEGEDSSENVVRNIQIVQGAPVGMLAWLVKNNVVKSAKQAEKVLLAVAVLAVIGAIAVIWLSNSSGKTLTTQELNLTRYEHIPTQ